MSLNLSDEKIQRRDCVCSRQVCRWALALRTGAASHSGSAREARSEAGPESPAPKKPMCRVWYSVAEEAYVPSVVLSKGKRRRW